MRTPAKKKMPPKKKAKWKSRLVYFAILLVIIIAIVLLSIKPDFNREPQKKHTYRTEVKFKKEGELSFIKKGSDQKIRTIDIELAQNDYERQMGLMYRRQMSDKQGMLFIMEREEPQSFWMHNTYIPLDIIYLNSKLEIVKIQKNNQPLNDYPIPSVKKAKYVVEVNGGFCDKYNIEEGDSIQYKVIPTQK